LVTDRSSSIASKTRETVARETQEKDALPRPQFLTRDLRRLQDRHRGLARAGTADDELGPIRSENFLLRQRQIDHGASKQQAGCLPARHSGRGRWRNRGRDGRGRRITYGLQRYARVADPQRDLGLRTLTQKIGDAPIALGPTEILFERRDQIGLGIGIFAENVRRPVERIREPLERFLGRILEDQILDPLFIVHEEPLDLSFDRRLRRIGLLVA
jgi:hypothetical protein